MTEVIAQRKRIHLLSTDIANKIAAGEVVERPASVLKELLENSIDAGATKIEVSIEHGGIKTLTVFDNGGGILREDLQLALQQHATSKIESVADLAQITSLGFRGEALASINSVSKLCVISNTEDQEHAWTIKNNIITPAAHPIGTTIKMQDLFYNVPARRKFLRSERTEYLYLLEKFRSIALSNFAVSFSLKSHGKLVKNLPACRDQASKTRRLMQLCGRSIVENSIIIDAEQNGMRLWGWLGATQHARSQEPHQYFFINQRVIKDRLINHAIRQVYAPLCTAGTMPFYSLYLELDPVALDVNVHPTKHEVRFRDARIIYAFITDILTASLTEQNKPWHVSLQSYKQNNVNDTQQKNILENVPKLLCILENKILVAQHQDRLILLDAEGIWCELGVEQLKNIIKVS